MTDPSSLGSGLEPATAVLGRKSALRRRIVQLLREADLQVVTQPLGPEVRMQGGSLDVIVWSTELSDERKPPQELELILDLRRRFKSAKIVLVVPERNGLSTARSSIENQTEGIVFTEQLDRALVPTVRAVHAEQVVVPPSKRRHTGLPALSNRERQVIRLAVMGQTNYEIAQDLYLSVSTVKSHLTSVFSKLGVRSRSEAAALLLDPSQPLRALIADQQGSLAVTSEGDG